MQRDARNANIDTTLCYISRQIRVAIQTAVRSAENQIRQSIQIHTSHKCSQRLIIIASVARNGRYHSSIRKRR